MWCFLVGLAIIIGAILGLIVFITATGIPIFRLREGEWPCAEDLSDVISHGFLGFAILVVVFLVVLLCVSIGCGILGR